MTDKDQIYQSDTAPDGPFRFDASVAAVFPDMLRRSIPGYSASIEAIGSLAARYVTSDTHCYDLGCSLGAATLAMRQGIRASNCRIIGIDNSEAMIERCTQVIEKDDKNRPNAAAVELRCADILDTDIRNASMIVLNYTLQFVAPDRRAALLQRLYNALVPGGVLLLSEKVVDENPRMEALLVELHLEHKRRNHYSELEIARKRAAIENVLRPETVAAHKQRLRDAGFEDSAVWLRYFNFVSIVAVK